MRCNQKSHNLLILSKCKRAEDREFYLRLAAREKWGKRELERQLNGALFKRLVCAPLKVSPPVTPLHPAAAESVQRQLPARFSRPAGGPFRRRPPARACRQSEEILHRAGRDFAFVGEQYVLQVGSRDFRLDLLFFHRELQCLGAIELKIEEFQPEHLGKLEFYLEALDRDVRKPHERPSIGVLLCATKDNEVVEYTLSRAASPTLIAEYQTQLPDRKLLLRKLHEFYELAQSLEEIVIPKRKPRKLKK